MFRPILVRYCLFFALLALLASCGGPSPSDDAGTARLDAGPATDSGSSVDAARVDSGPGANQPPAFNRISVNGDVPFFLGETVSVVVTAEDPDGDTITYSWETCEGARSGASITLTVTDIEGCAATVTASDGRAEASWEYSVQSIALQAGDYTVTGGASVVGESTASDPAPPLAENGRTNEVIVAFNVRAANDGSIASIQPIFQILGGSLSPANERVGEQLGTFSTATPVRVGASGDRGVVIGVRWLPAPTVNGLGDLMALWSNWSSNFRTGLISYSPWALTDADGSDGREFDCLVTTQAVGVEVTYTEGGPVHTVRLRCNG